jgi:hypothetical protein
VDIGYEGIIISNNLGRITLVQNKLVK